MKPTSKNELKKKYNISNDDFEILTEPPSEEERRSKGGYFIKVGESVGLQEWMWKTWPGILLAIVIVLPSVCGLYDYWRPKAVYAYSEIPKYLQVFDPQKEKDNTGYIAFSSQDTIQQQTTQQPTITIWSTGTIVTSGLNIRS